jgi:hypothetical protein
VTEDDGTADRASPMLYDGGLAVGGESSFVPAAERGHPRLDCPAPRIGPAGVSGWYRCPACAGKVRLADHETAREFGYRVSESMLAMVGAALVFPFRRQQHLEGKPVDQELDQQQKPEFYLECVGCAALGGERDADYLLDGMSLCGEHAAPMLKVLAERMSG